MTQRRRPKDNDLATKDVVCGDEQLLWLPNRRLGGPPTTQISHLLISIRSWKREATCSIARGTLCRAV